MTWTSSKNKKPAQAAVVSTGSSTGARASGGGKGGNKPKRVNVLDIRTVETKNGPKPKIQFAKDVEIFYKGEKLDLGEYNSGFLKTKDELIADLDFLVEKEYMTGEQAQERSDFYDEKNITSVLSIALGE